MALKDFRGFRVRRETKGTEALLGSPPLILLLVRLGNLVVLVCNIRYIWFILLVVAYGFVLN